jgi:hypothetical protein
MPYYEQPQDLPRINWGNPITRGLVFLVVYSDAAARNLVTGDAASVDSAATRSVGPAGRSLVGGASTKAASWPGTISTSDGAGNGDFTLLSYSFPPLESATFALLSQCAGNGLPQIYLMANTADTYAAASGYVSFGSTAGMVTSVAAFDGLSPHVFVGGRNGASPFIDVDGVSKTLNTGTLTAGDGYTAGSSEIYASGIKGYSGWTRAHPHFIQAAWNRALTSHERRSIGFNPAQLFADYSYLDIAVLFGATSGGANEGIAAATGTATATARSAATAQSLGIATGIALSGAIASAAGTSAATAYSSTASIASATGNSTATALSGSIGSSAGTSTAAGYSSASSIAAAAGSSSALAIAGFIAQSTASSSSIAVSGSVAQAVGASAANAVGLSGNAGIGEASGSSAAYALAGSEARAFGSATVTGHPHFTTLSIDRRYLVPSRHRRFTAKARGRRFTSRT